MQTENRLLDDFARVATGALGTLQGVREEVTARLRDQLERLLNDLDLVPREEFEAVKAMAAEARKQNEALAKRVAALEAAAKGGKPARKSVKAAGAKAKAGRTKSAKATTGSKTGSKTGTGRAAKAKRAPRRAETKKPRIAK